MSKKQPTDPKQLIWVSGSVHRELSLRKIKSKNFRSMNDVLKSILGIK